MTKSAKAVVYAFITAVLVVAVAVGRTFTGGDTEVPVDVIAATLPVAAPVEEEPATLRELTEDEIARVNEAFSTMELYEGADQHRCDCSHSGGRRALHPAHRDVSGAVGGTFQRARLGGYQV